MSSVFNVTPTPLGEPLQSGILHPLNTPSTRLHRLYLRFQVFRFSCLFLRKPCQLCLLLPFLAPVGPNSLNKLHCLNMLPLNRYKLPVMSRWEWSGRGILFSCHLHLLLAFHSFRVVSLPLVNVCWILVIRQYTFVPHSRASWPLRVVVQLFRVSPSVIL